MYFGPILRHFRFKLGVLFSNLRFCWAYIGPLRAKFGPTTYWVSWRAICWVYFVPSGHIGSFQGYVGPIGVLGHLEGYVEILEGYKAICG